MMTVDQKTIDRVCVGLADLAITARDGLRLISPSLSQGPYALTLLCDLLGIPEPIPDWAERALEGHHGTPEELVAALRELAGTNRSTILCHVCGAPGFRQGDGNLMALE
jgi:hypothetical protein